MNFWCCDTQVSSHLILDPSLYSLSHVVRYQKLNWKFGVSDSGWSWCIFVHVPITSRYVPPCLGGLGPQWWPGRRACVLDILRSQFVSLWGYWYLWVLWFAMPWQMWPELQSTGAMYQIVIQSMYVMSGRHGKAVALPHTCYQENSLTKPLKSTCGKHVWQAKSPWKQNACSKAT